MQVRKDSVSLVIVGAWNNSILRPEWVAVYGLGVPEGQEISVELLTPVGGEGAPVVRFEKLVYTVQSNRLMIKPQLFDAEGLEIVQKAALGILEQLPHTPVAAIGFNFGFTAESADDQIEAFRRAQAAVVDAAPEEWAVERNKIITTLSKDGVNWNVTRELEGATAVVETNIHAPISSVSAMKAFLDEHSFAEAFGAAKELAARILNEELQNDE